MGCYTVIKDFGEDKSLIKSSNAGSETLFLNIRRFVEFNVQSTKKNSRQAHTPLPSSGRFYFLFLQP